MGDLSQVYGGTGNILLILRGVKVPLFGGSGFDILMADNKSIGVYTSSKGPKKKPKEPTMMTTLECERCLLYKKCAIFSTTLLIGLNMKLKKKNLRKATCISKQIPYNKILSVRV